VKFPSQGELWKAYVPTPPEQKREERFLNVFGRLRDGGSRAQGLAELNGIAKRLATAYPATNREFTFIGLNTFNQTFNAGPIRVVLLSMLGAVFFVLLIACANVANLLLSRSAQRSREVAVRIALGATRWRIIRQLLIESVLLGCIGGILGLGLASVGVRLFDMAVRDVGKPYWIVFSMDYVVFGYLAAVCVLTGILFGLAPALQVSRTNVNDVLKEGGRGNAGGRRGRWMTGTMVVLELALTLVLLVGAGLMVRSFLNTYTLDLGIRTDHLMTMRMQLPDTKYPALAATAPAGTMDSRVVFFDRLMPRVAAIPGVQSAALTTSVPPMGIGRRPIEIEGRPLKPGDRPQTVSTVVITPSYFDTVGVHLQRGRAFTAVDGTPGNETIVVSEAFVSQFFKNEDPIGRRVRFSRSTAGQPASAAAAAAPVWRTIVGISPNVRYSQPQDSDPAAVVYTPLRQDPPRGLILLVRSRVDPGAMMSAVRREVQAIDQDQPVFTVQTMDQLLAQVMWPYQVFGSLFAIFAVIALMMSAVGLYAVMAYSVTQRTAEIGVRMALGAERRQVSWLILKRGLLQMAIGLTVGLAGAFAVSRVMRTLLVQVSPTDPLTFAAITLMLSAVAVAACLIPARRATRIDPLVALRAQ
ncbi:MAG: ADOP family duplicated permease, partial [Vicinamibacterales bacterium]